MNNTLNINIYLNKKEDITDKFDNNKLSHELSKYIYNKCFGTPIKHNIILNIICNFDINNKDIKNITNMIKHNYKILFKEHTIHLNYNYLKSIILFVIGIIFIGISRIIKFSNNFILGEILLIIGWVSIWEATYNFIFFDSRERIKIKRFKKLIKCEIKFNK